MTSKYASFIYQHSENLQTVAASAASCPLCNLIMLEVTAFPRTVMSNFDPGDDRPYSDVPLVVSRPEQTAFELLFSIPLPTFQEQEDRGNDTNLYHVAYICLCAQEDGIRKLIHSIVISVKKH